MHELEGSTLILILALAALAVLIGVFSVLLAPYTCGRALARLARRPREEARGAGAALTPRQLSLTRSAR